ncbi:hypothetical protein [Deinococcus aquiradiocola]|uniref:Uncharacterized protein n=1 Tax=Deinococcus aquiradiocola TaxID=393059 RepID=A0A917P931_9DEIO|nr:hypothetical protein [Deinococcus aquiradiocola]GGJ67305.1 hypothetical protein GCM10008939_09430 [Deinococcus aquiradiocola]
MARPRSVPSPEEQLRQQRALGRSATRVDIVPAAAGDPGLSLFAGPRTVLVGPTDSGHDRLPWQLYPADKLDGALRTLHAQILEEAHALPDLLAGLDSADPEAAAPRSVHRRLGRMLALRSMLELAAAWEDAPAPGQVAPGWTSGPDRRVGVLPWHAWWVQVRQGWHLHHLSRWHAPHRGPGPWKDLTAAWITRAALLEDMGPDARPCSPLCATPEGRERQRTARPDALSRPPGTPVATRVDTDPDAFARRVRLALSLILEPALAGFLPDEVLAAVQGTKSGTAALSRLLPGVTAGPVQALASMLRAQLPHSGHFASGVGARSAVAAGPCPVRRGAWTAARAAFVSPLQCLRAEAAAGPLHLLVPGLPHAGLGSPALQEERLSGALEEVTDLFTAVAALPAEQTLPLPDLSGLLTGRGFLRLGTHAPPQARTEPLPATFAADDVWHRERALALLTVPGLTEAVAALQAVNVARERGLSDARREVCLASGLSAGELEEATGGERAFDRTPTDAGLERTLHWSGGIWSVVLARHPQDLISDGRTLSHCVGWGGYAHSVRAERTRIVRVLACDPDGPLPVPLLTLELKRAGEGSARAQSGWVLAQARGANNRPPTRDEAALLTLWAREVGVQLDGQSEVAPLNAAAARADAARLAVDWVAVDQETLPEDGEATPTPPPIVLQAAVAQLAAAISARWTPAATRTHQEGLRRVAQLVERARQHLQTELLRLHAAGEPRLTGSVPGDALLPGTGLLTLARDERPLLQALTQAGHGPTRPVGLRIDARIALQIDADLHAQERRHTLDLRPGRRPGEIALHFVADGHGSVNTYLSPAGLMNTGLLDPLHAGGGGSWSWGVPRRRQAGLTLLSSLLDEPLGPLATAATAATRQPGDTLRAQLHAWTGTPAARRSLAHHRNRNASANRS